MNISSKQLVKAADFIRQQLLSYRCQRYEHVTKTLNDLFVEMLKTEAIWRKLKICQRENWNAAAKKIVPQIYAAVSNIPFFIEQITHAKDRCDFVIPGIRCISNELIQADDEFEGLNYQEKEHVLSVTTDPVELDGVYLGEFEIFLDISKLTEADESRRYWIIALDPHPAEENDSYTHPHVQNEHLCSGDASAAINSALCAGRICDFFMLVNSVLHTYNPSSPYVALENWYGRECDECGYMMNSDEYYWCEYCEMSICSSCSASCDNCHSTTCSNCWTKCSVCDEFFCPNCIRTCPGCGEHICFNCYENLECPCLEEEDDNEEDKCEQDNDVISEENNNTQKLKKQKHKKACA